MVQCCLVSSSEFPLSLFLIPTLPHPVESPGAQQPYKSLASFSLCQELSVSMARNSCIYGHSPSRGMEIYSLQNRLSLLNCNKAPAIVGIQIHVSPRKGCHSSEGTGWDPTPWKHK